MDDLLRLHPLQDGKCVPDHGPGRQSEAGRERWVVLGSLGVLDGAQGRLFQASQEHQLVEAQARLQRAAERDAVMAGQIRHQAAEGDSRAGMALGARLLGNCGGLKVHRVFSRKGSK